jgi:hypothetical protein
MTNGMNYNVAFPFQGRHMPLEDIFFGRLRCELEHEGAMPATVSFCPDLPGRHLHIRRYRRDRITIQRTEPLTGLVPDRTSFRNILMAVVSPRANSNSCDKVKFTSSSRFDKRRFVPSYICAGSQVLSVSPQT